MRAAWIVAALALAGCEQNAEHAKRPPAEKPAEKEVAPAPKADEKPVELLAADLANEYRKNPAATNQKYRGKKLRVDKIAIDRILQGPGKTYLLMCEFDINPEQPGGEMKKGSYVVVCPEETASRLKTDRLYGLNVSLDGDALGDMRLRTED